ncbi:MAG: protein phosphatase 2C domain-containing protein [Oscillospiraceae bacterium]|nr:protein phosphatase 2C domain-containing protein [Oscillospiraceae bacterium]
MKITAMTDIGKVYEDNQDYYVAGRLSDDTYWVVLCDGMGGMKSGARASRMAGDYLQSQVEKRLVDLIEPDGVKAWMLECVQKASDLVFKEGGGRDAVMGTTAVFAVVRNNNVQLVHAGDSRAYHITKKGIRQITRDHSMVQELLDSGRITPEQALRHPNRNIITSALGIDRRIRMDYNECRLAKGELLLICSDGLSNMLTDDELLALARKEDFYRTAPDMVRQAVDAGGFDNITAVVLGA